MPQISSNRMAQPLTDGSASTIVEVTRFLEKLSRDLDQEICNALLEENNDLAERLNIPFTQAKRLAKALADPSEHM